MKIKIQKCYDGIQFKIKIITLAKLDKDLDLYK